MDKKQVAGILDEIGTLLELRGENSFKCRAYHNAARTVGALTRDIESYVTSGTLQEIKGIGEALSEKITELIKTGRLQYYDDLKSSLPPGLTDMLGVPGLGPKRVKILYDRLGIKTLEQLRDASEKHQLAEIEGFGAKTEENVLKGIALLHRHIDKHLYHKASQAATRVLESIREQKGVIRAEVAGSLRRRKEIIGDIDILASAKPANAQAIMKAFVSHDDVEEVIAHGDTKSSVRLNTGINCDLRVVKDSEFPFALAYFTGSKEHNIEMRSLAKKFGWSLNEYGFSPGGTKSKDGRVKRIVECETEDAIFKALKLEPIPPELRENMGEIEAAEEGRLPNLVSEQDIRGTFHCHTLYSDGANALEEMVEAARLLGWNYLGIADHSKVAAYAGGLSEEKVRQQQKEIDRLNERIDRFRVFKGTEVDILPNGSLDFSNKVLASFDYVVASVHSKFKMSEVEMTKRILKAIKNKYVTMLGHPTGRLLLEREPYPINMIDVINAAYDYGKAIEINAHPMRLDLDWRLCKYAKEKGVKIAINPDAHNTDGLRDVTFGVGIARKGWLEPSDIINCWSVDYVEKYFGQFH